MNITNITLIGRNLELYQLFYHIISENRSLFFVIGERGSGRTELVR
jgi:hypothetical protein